MNNSLPRSPASRNWTRLTDAGLPLYSAWWGRDIKEETVISMLAEGTTENSNVLEVNSGSGSKPPSPVRIINIDQGITEREIGKIIMREEYGKALDFILPIEREFTDSKGYDGKGVIITGHPGIGQ